MSLLDEVNAAMSGAMKANDPVRLGTLRLLKSALVNRRVETGRDLDEAEARRIVGTLIKQRRDSIEHFAKAGRHDLAGKEAAEIEILERYLPPAADPMAVERAVDAAIAETGASSPKDLGRVMKAAMAKLAGQTIDGRTVNELVRRKLGAQ